MCALSYFSQILKLQFSISRLKYCFLRTLPFLFKLLGLLATSASLDLGCQLLKKDMLVEDQVWKSCLSVLDLDYSDMWFLNIL